MAINRKCPKCGSNHVQLSNERTRHGCLWTILFGLYYIIWRLISMIIGLVIVVAFDWWVALIKRLFGKGHVWVGKKLMSGKKQIFYCHDCGYNFRA